MPDDIKRNLLFFEAPTMRELYRRMDEWQETERKRLLSMHGQRDGERFGCIALTHPPEKMMLASDGTGVDAALTQHGVHCLASMHSPNRA